MRFAELFESAAPLKIVATKRFIKDTQFYIRSTAGVLTTLRDFLNFKIHEPKQSFGIKDTPFIGKNIKGRHLQHCHIVHGKVILLYKIENGYLELLDMLEHSAYDTDRGQGAIASYADSLRPSDFMPYTAPASKAQVAVGDEWDLETYLVLPDEEMQELNGLIWGWRRMIATSWPAPYRVISATSWSS
jgi:mRNA-degrading endonuclease YafQ of YafQ-DinJ toxin-antitoxin module